MKKIQETINLLGNSEFFYTLIIGMNGTYEYVSPNYDEKFKFLGYSLVNKPFDVTLHPEDKEICQNAGFSSINNPDKLFPALLRKHDGSGGYIFTQWEFKGIFQNGVPNGVFCLGYNITEHVSTSEKLYTAKNEIENKNSELEDIGLTQSHIVRRPIANILGLLETIDEQSSIEEYKSIFNYLKSTTMEIDNIIKQINNKIHL